MQGGWEKGERNGRTSSDDRYDLLAGDPASCSAALSRGMGRQARQAGLRSQVGEP